MQCVLAISWFRLLSYVRHPLLQEALLRLSFYGVSDDCQGTISFAFLDMIVPGVVDLSVLIPFYGGKATSGSLGIIILTSYAELWSLLLRKLPFLRTFLQTILAKNSSIGE